MKNFIDHELSEDERIKKAAEILAPYIIQHIKNKRVKKEDKKKN